MYAAGEIEVRAKPLHAVRSVGRAEVEWYVFVAALVGPALISLLAELVGGILRGLFPAAGRWWDRGGRLTTRLWVLALGGLVTALVLGVAVASIPGLVALGAITALAQRVAVAQGYRRSRDGSWSVGE
jgi:hypothetical protein